MNSLEQVILDQHARVRDAGSDPAETLAESQGEILDAATPDLILELLRRDNKPAHETRSTNAMCRAFDDSSSVTRRLSAPVQTAHGLARLTFLADKQGYTGGLIFDGDDTIVYGDSMTFNRVNPDDPIQEAMGDVPYPAMMWAKALRAEAYKNRPESARQVTIATYLAEMGLSLGSNVTEQGDIVGATGFMPGVRLLSLGGSRLIDQHLESEETEVFRLSGLCDQAVVEPDILTATNEFARNIIKVGGSLN